ncbi:phage holin family protein [Paenibacillus lautus]|uniref:phage holin family protein n=1 Tax=Paenibacillus lautus TaxID=1401 RepID=UPI001C7D2CBB|nr:phage holin family protein [Paenibacillus lautus]MBX4147493.1 phage holin family protein [Paenibacillus lautus]
MDDITFKILANKDHSLWYALSGVTGSIVSYAFGGWSGVLELLLIFFAVDYVTGCAASIKTGKGLRSNVGRQGIMKKGFMLLLVFLGHKIDTALQMNIVMNATIYFWLANELVSIVENYGRLGFKVPGVFKKVITVLQEKSGEEDTSNQK